MLAFADFVPDPVRLRLCRRDTGAVVPLTPKVFEALAYLVAHRDEVLDKETLLEAIWPGLIVEENSLTQTISTLRNESLELGMTEALISGLAALPGVVIPPMSSLLRFNAIDQDPLAAGRALRVHAVLEGSLQRDGDRLRVSARLMRVADGQQHWAGRFDASFTTIFDVQDTLARKVTESLATEFGIVAPPPSVRRYTQDAEAYQLYLNGRFAWTHLTDVSLPLAINYFQQALARDPNYALAHTGLADCYILIGVFGMRPPHDAFRRRHSPSPGSFSDVAQALALTGDRTGALAELAQLLQRSAQRYVPAYDIAAILARLNQVDAALDALEQTLTERGAMIGWMRHDPAFDALRDEPRYQALAAVLPPISRDGALAASSR